ncbi:MAG: hypothetical protein CME65_12120 [Halobacteriovoraceae bacterium]|nr:hypothetical protein [Halobacteriovoraceae bacterium]|tara:strand:+ start:14216 stop:17737 length:3522 start_codon:yes stop_codon:yes gene_type:complete
MRNVLLLALIVTLQSCIGEPQEVTELTFEEKSASAESARAFQNTVHPLLKASCAGCHGDSGSQAPKHSVSDFRSAHDAVVDTGRVNFQEPAKSRLVRRLSEDRHYCWSDCQANANEMLQAIEDWKANSGGLGGVSGKITHSLKISQGQDKIAETINGTVVLQAEDGALSGRFKIKTASQASGLRYISGDQPPVHPKEATSRNGSIGIGCDVSSGIDNTVLGPFRISERQRHVNQSGHQFYSSQVVMTWIDPDERENYEAALLDPNITDYTPYFFRNEDGDFIRINSIRVLPEFMRANFFNSNIRSVVESANATPSLTYTWGGETNLVFDFFAPRFGSSGAEYFLANTNEIIEGLPSSAFRDQMYSQLSDRIYNIFDDASDLGDIPEGLRIVNGNVFNFSDKENQVNLFHAHFMGNLSEPADAVVVNGNGLFRLHEYVHYEVSAGSRETYRNINWDPEGAINLSSFGNTFLDLAALYTGGSVKTVGQIQAETFGETLKPVFTGASCVNCHADGSDRPQFAQADDIAAYNQAAAVGGFVNFDIPRNARPVQRMLDDRHNCGGASACNTLGNMMISAINDWETAISTALAAQANSQDTGLEELSVEQRTPGKAVYKFRVNDPGEYNVWLKLMAPENNTDRVKLQIKDEGGNVVRNCRADSVGACTTSSIQDALCREYATNERNWEWYTPNINNESQRVKWDLGAGVYTLEIIEDDIDVKIDLVAINKNPQFNPAKNLIDEGFIQDANPRTLRYDLSSLLGSRGFFEIDVKVSETDDSYIFRNPRFVDGTRNFRFRNIKVLVNGNFELSNSTYSKLDRVTGPNSGILTYSPLVVLEVLGPASDEFAFVFEDLQYTNLPSSVLDEDAPVAVEGRKCKELALFEQSVMPILNQFRLVLKEEYMDYTSSSFPGTNGNTAENMTFYTCTTCHNEDHPFFKMTTFFDNSQVLCEQALSRVDFGNFERSLLLRGINGTFNHPKLHFIQDVNITGSGTNRRFVASTSDASGFASTWRGNRLLRYTQGSNKAAGQIDLNAYSGSDREYLEKFIGTFQRVRYRTYQNVQSPDNGDILTENGSVDNSNPDIPRYIQSGRSLYDIRSPEDYLNRQDDWNSNNPTAEGEIAVNRDCMGVNFQNQSGTIVDPSSCGNNGDYEQEFENIKTKYRDAVINWMEAEKRAFQNQ